MISLKISPLDIYNHEFNKTTFGYSVKQVDDFMEEIGVSYERLFKEVNILQDENEKLKDKVSDQEKMEEKLQKLMLTVQETAREITEQAHREADLIIKKAEIKAERIESNLKKKLNEEYKSLKSLQESRELFKIRIKTMVEAYLELLNNDQEPDINIEVERDIAANSLDLDESE